MDLWRVELREEKVRESPLRCGQRGEKTPFDSRQSFFSDLIFNLHPSFHKTVSRGVNGQRLFNLTSFKSALARVRS